MKCLKPALTAVPDGEWFCPECEKDPGAPVGVTKSKKGKKRSNVQAAEEDEDEPELKAAGKRKAPKAKGAGTFDMSCTKVNILTKHGRSFEAQEVSW
jgi:uncharacterized Zn finger protein (UPF0148 family)